MNPPTCKTHNKNLLAWIPIIIMLGGIIAWAAQTDSAQNVKIDRLEIESASVWKLLPEMQEQLTRIITILEIREGTQ